MIKRTSFLLIFFVANLIATSAYSVTVSKSYVDSSDKTLQKNIVKVLGMVNQKDGSGDYISLNTNAKLAIPAINELKAILDTKANADDVLTADSLAELNQAVTALESDKATVADLEALQGTVDALGDTYATDDEVSTAIANVQSAIDNIDLSAYAKTADLATVATSGQYADLQGKPDIPSIEGLAKSSELETLRSTLQAAINEKQEKGSYADADELEALQETVQSLQNDAVDKETVENLQTSVETIAADYAKKSELTSTEQSLRAAINGVKDLIPTNVSAFNNDAGYQTAGDVSTAIGTATANLATKTELNAKQNVINVENKLSAEYVSGLADVATTGSYESLTDKPTIPSTENLATKDELNAKQNVINAENMLSAGFVSGLATVATSGQYADLQGKPDIPSTENLATKDELNAKQNVINADNMLSSEYVSGLADVATTGSYESLTDKPTIPSTENLVTKDELNDLQNALQAKINEMHESGDYATAESLLAVSESLATLKGDVYTKAQVDKMIADVISGGQINLEGYAKQADLNTLSGIVDAIKLKTDVLGALAYKDTVATTDIDAKAVTTAQIAGGTPAEGDSMMLMSTNKDGTVTWTSVRIY